MPKQSAATQHYLGVVDAIMPELERLADEVEKTERISDELLQLLTDNDLFRMTVPEAWGGRGLTFQEYFPVMQRAGGVSGAIRMLMHGQNGLWRLIHDWGTTDQKNEWLPIIVRSGALMAFSLTEPGNGSGRDLSTRAEPKNGGWLLNGEKWFVTFGQQAAVTHLLAVTEQDGDGAQLTCFLLPGNAEGAEWQAMQPTMGVRGTQHDVLTLRDCWLPESAVLGPVGKGLDIALRGFLDEHRLSNAASSVALARRALDLTVEFAQTRHTFGKPIAARQAIKTQIADMAAQIFAVQKAVEATTELFDEGVSITAEASMCKLLGLEMVGRVTDRALRIHGGIGYTEAMKIERHYRDARSLWFEEGTAEIQREVVSAKVVGEGFRP